MVMGHSTRDAKYILTGDSIADLEKGLAEMKRQIAAGISFSVCYGGEEDKNDFEKEYDSEYTDDDCDCDIYTCCDDCDKCGDYDWHDVYEYDREEDYDSDWDVCCECAEDDCDNCPLVEKDEEEETTIAEDKVRAEMIAELMATIKDILGL